MIQKGKANIIIGGQWGSEGKGKLAGYLYHKYPEINIAVSGFTPNTGHTYIDDAGKSYVSKILPIGTIFESVDTVLIGPHAVFNVDRFLQECSEFRHRESNAEIYVHPLACIVTSKNVADESRNLNRIASTMQGSASARITKIMRHPDIHHFARDEPRLQSMIVDTQIVAQRRLDQGDTILIETGQGFDLGLNYGYKWPYVTGRDCMVGRELDNAGVSPKQIGSIIVALRTYPIRVGNTEGGRSGPHHPDQEEITWDILSQYLGRRVIEMTTVTKRVRRVFTWSDMQVDGMCRLVKPDYAFLNFVNYLNSDEYDQIIGLTSDLLKLHDCKLRLLGTGAGLNEMKVIE